MWQNVCISLFGRLIVALETKDENELKAWRDKEQQKIIKELCITDCCLSPTWPAITGFETLDQYRAVKYAPQFWASTWHWLLTSHMQTTRIKQCGKKTSTPSMVVQLSAFDSTLCGPSKRKGHEKIDIFKLIPSGANSKRVQHFVIPLTSDLQCKEKIQTTKPI